MARDMTDVELDDAPAAGPGGGGAARAGRTIPPGDATAARRAAVGRVLRRWGPGVAVVLLGLIGWQLVAGARERAVAERHRTVPGVVGTTVTPPLDATAWGGAGASLLLRAGVPVGEDRVVGVTADPGGALRTVVLLDVATGSERWRTTLPTPAGSGGEAVSCEVDAEPARRVWCTTTDGDAPAPPTTTLVGLDVGTGAVVDRRTVPSGALATVAGDLLVTAVSVPGVVDLVATPLTPSDAEQTSDDPATTADATAWTRRLTVPEPTAATAGRSLFRAGDRLLLRDLGREWVLHPEDGRVEAEGQALEQGRGGRLLDVRGSSGTGLLGTDGRGTAQAEGTPLVVHPDDGSALDVEVLIHRDGTPRGLLRGVDAATGAVLWEHPGPHPSALFLVLLDGVLYGDDGDTVWARDARTGAERWRTATGSAPVSTLMTDGVRLLRSELDPDGDGLLLVGYDLTDGARAWAAPLTGGVRDLWTAPWVPGGPLLGRTDDGVMSSLR
jgi:outer membrane protein assembly factor BamB